MEKNNSYQCPVCGNEVPAEASMCPECGWLRIIYPANIPGPILKLEEERLQKAKELRAKLEEERKAMEIAAQELRAEGYLAMKQGDTLIDVLPVGKGINIYGRNPKKKEGLRTVRIVAASSDLSNEHFSINVTENDTFEAKRLNGKWGLRNKYNNTESGLLENGDSIFIGDLELVFVISSI